MPFPAKRATRRKGRTLSMDMFRAMRTSSTTFLRSQGGTTLQAEARSMHPTAQKNRFR